MHTLKQKLCFLDSYIVNELTDCWIWIGNINSKGYGHTSYGKRAHRESYRIFIGEIPEGYVVMHICDNRACINPSHLKLGTPKDNSNDMIKKGRSARGANHSQAKLTEDQVRKIKSKLANGVTAYRLSKNMGIPRSTISDIKLRKTWKHTD